MKIIISASIDHEIKQEAQNILNKRNPKLSLSKYIEESLKRLILEEGEKEVKEDGII